MLRELAKTDKIAVTEVEGRVVITVYVSESSWRVGISQLQITLDRKEAADLLSGIEAALRDE